MPEDGRRATEPPRRRVPIAYCPRCQPADAVEPARGAALDAYRSVTIRLLPALSDRGAGNAAVTSALGGMAIRILRYAPMWGEHGAVLTAAVHCAVRLFHANDRTELAALLQAMARRLHLLATGAAMTFGVDGPANKSPNWRGYRHE